MTQRLRVGRPCGIPLSPRQRDVLYKLLGQGIGMTCRELAKKIGITYTQLYNPLQGKSNCSRESYRKISRFIEKHCPQGGE